MTALVIVGILIVLLGRLMWKNAKLEQTVSTLTSTQASRDRMLDYVLRKFSLHVSDPYVVKPGFDDPRCFHCFYPREHGHDRECPWALLRPFTEKLYA